MLCCYDDWCGHLAIIISQSVPHGNQVQALDLYLEFMKYHLVGNAKRESSCQYCYNPDIICVIVLLVARAGGDDIRGGGGLFRLVATSVVAVMEVVGVSSVAVGEAIIISSKFASRRRCRRAV